MNAHTAPQRLVCEDPIAPVCPAGSIQNGDVFLAVEFEIEVEVGLSGKFQRAEPDVGISSDYYDDTCFESAVVLRQDRKLVGGTLIYVTTRIDLCEGLDPKARAIVLANLFEGYGDGAAQEALAEASL